MKHGRKASAVAYDPAEPAPVLLISGRGGKAERMIRAAGEAGVAVVKDPGLAALLDAARPGDYIPPWCWEAAAKILVFVLEREKSNGPGKHISGQGT
jgi:type III secretion system FlhB-like substrate exporter